VLLLETNMSTEKGLQGDCNGARLLSKLEGK
jgi:hypothetical protein